MKSCAIFVAEEKTGKVVGLGSWSNWGPEKKNSLTTDK